MVCRAESIAVQKPLIMLGNLSEKFRCDSYIILWVGISYDMIQGMYSPHTHKHTLKLMVRQTTLGNHYVIALTLYLEA